MKSCTGTDQTAVLNRVTSSAERKAGLVAGLPLRRVGTPARNLSRIRQVVIHDRPGSPRRWREIGNPIPRNATDKGDRNATERPSASVADQDPWTRSGVPANARQQSLQRSMSVQAATSPTEIDSRTRGLLEAPLLRTLMKLAAPNAAVMVTQISIPLVEIYFIAKNQHRCLGRRLRSLSGVVAGWCDLARSCWGRRRQRNRPDARQRTAQ